MNTSLTIRVLLLAFWVGMLDLWLARHFRTGVGANELSVLVGVPLGSLLSIGIVDFLLGKEKRESWQESARDYLRQFITRHLSPAVIATLYIGSILFATVFSTLSISALAEGEKQVVLTPIARSGDSITAATAKDKPLDINLWINPFAAEYRLSVDGFLPRVVRVRPLIGALIVPGQDLVAVPTVLFRPGPNGYINLGSGGSFEVFRKVDGKFEPLGRAQGTHAWYLGPRRNQPGEMRNEWRIDLVARKTGQTEQAILMQRWRNPRKLDVADIGPGEELCALVGNVDGTVYVEGVVGKVSEREYIEFLLGELKHGPADGEGNDTQGSGVQGISGPDLCAWLDGGAS